MKMRVRGLTLGGGPIWGGASWGGVLVYSMENFDITQKYSYGHSMLIYDN